MIATVAGNGKRLRQVMKEEEDVVMIQDVVRHVFRTVRRLAPPCPSRMVHVTQVDFVV